MSEPDFQRRRDAIEIVLEQILTEVPRRRFRRPRHAGAFVGAHQHAAAFLAHVDLTLEIDAVQLFLLALEFRDVIRDQVLVLHREDGQLKTGHTTDFACPQAAGVHDVLGVDGALFGDHIPRAIRALHGVDDAVLTNDFRTTDLRGLGVGVRHAIWIDVAFDGVVHRADKMLFIE